MWEEYKAIEPRIIRPLNGNEIFGTEFYLNIVDVFPKFSTEEFKKRAQENLPKIEVFNHAIKRIKGHPFWIHKPFEIHIKEIPYSEDEEIENFLKKDEEWIIPYDPVYDEENNDVQLLFNFKICQLEKTNQTKLTFGAAHIICDGRTIFDLYDLIRKVIQGETLEKDDGTLVSFDERECFQNTDESFYKPPKVWDEVDELHITPKIDDIPYKYITRHYIYDYAPISKFNRANGVTVQAMLMAILTRATRRYKNLPKERPIWCGVPVDTRFSSFATKEFKNRKYYRNNSAIYPKVIGQDTLMKDIQHCVEKLQEAKKTNDDIRQILCSSTTIDPKTFQLVPNGRIPNFHTQATVNGSNIGKVNGNNPIFYISNGILVPGMYLFFYHSYHTDDKLYISALSPINFDKTYINYIKEEMDKVFIPENIPKY
ncbi:hypothetical protein H8356DRAFT_1625566 [Neocallimastix lanati (nom. inval.)]|nr:hypothetical protein H8356DRAFT_1625566 [Neocallimastix sp. JGI-2020a]